MAPNPGRFRYRRRTGPLVWIALVSAIPGAALGDDKPSCESCHADPKSGAPAVTIPKTSGHADVACGDCHPKVEKPGPQSKPPAFCKGRPPASCEECHADESKAFAGSTHGKDLQRLLSKAPGAKPSALCAACHGTSPHDIRRAKDPESPVNRARLAGTCLACHQEGRTIAVSAYLDSVHGVAQKEGRSKAAVCTDCHGTHAIDPPTLPASKVHHLSVSKTCGECHPEALKDYATSIHWAAAGRGLREAPVCTDCHGEHGIRSRQDPASPTWAGNVTKTCAACHASERMASKFAIPSDRVTSFRESFHGLSGRLGDLRVAHCASCHGNHAILPAADPRSSIHPANLGRTCGSCHPGAETRFIAERIHTSPRRESHWTVAWVRTIYLWLIALTIGGMLVHNGLDLVFKARGGVPWRREEALTPRFGVAERIQHALLAVSFVLMAVSGLALKFPDSAFAWPFRWLDEGADVRRWAHRGAALVFVALGLYHVMYLRFSVRGREQWRALRPRRRDATDALGALRRYLGAGGAPPTLPHYGYVEKAEYWALVWGGVVMTATGAVLFFNSAALASVRVWVLDLAAAVHFWEAMLAILAIAVWHGYWVVFDPDVYPMNLTWLTGRPPAHPNRTP